MRNGREKIKKEGVLLTTLEIG